MGVVPERFRGIPGGGEEKSLLGWLCACRAKAEVLGGVRNAFLALDKTGCKSFFGQGGMRGVGFCFLRWERIPLLECRADFYAHYQSCA